MTNRVPLYSLLCKINRGLIRPSFNIPHSDIKIKTLYDAITECETCMAFNAQAEK